MNKYIFIKVSDSGDLNYVFRRGFVYKDKDGKLQRKSKEYIENQYNKLKETGRYTGPQIYYMIKRADEDCDRYIDLHKDDKPVEIPRIKKGYKDMTKEEYINYLINSGYSDVDAKDKADALYGEDDE